MISRRGFFGACAAAAGAAVAAPLLGKRPVLGITNFMGFEFFHSEALDPVPAPRRWIFPEDGSTGYAGYTLHTRIAARSIDPPNSGQLLFHQIMVR